MVQLISNERHSFDILLIQHLLFINNQAKSGVVIYLQTSKKKGCSCQQERNNCFNSFQVQLKVGVLLI
jgi:hypothetical protein